MATVLRQTTMNLRQRKHKKSRRQAHPHSIQRARTERRYQAEQHGFTCVKACPHWYPHPDQLSECGVCGRKLKKARAKVA